jgi:hypothetical protein
MNQASFFCPNCRQQRLFQSTPMNHTPHILAAVFLCGFWLPIWILMAVTHQDVWRCAFCGHSDAVKYLANPTLRQDEQVAAEYRRREDQERREEKERLLAAMPRESASDNLAYHWAAHKTPILAGGGAVMFIGFLIVAPVINHSVVQKTNQTTPGTTSSTVSGPIGDVKPIFDAATLAGKSPKEVQKTLGSPTDSWTPRTGLNNLMQSYALGEEMTVEFRNNSIDSFVIFFNQKNVDPQTAQRLVGLNPSQPRPKGISNINTGENWIKVFYANTVTNSSDTTLSTNSKSAVGPSSSSRKALIISENANFRSTADSYGEILNVVPYGEEVEIVKQKGPWFQVKYLGQSGWVHGNTIRLLN